MLSRGRPLYRSKPAGFVWSTWGQENAGHSALQADDPSQPQPGDMVLFGSPMPGRRGKVDWVLDTVVVLRRRLPVDSAPN